jgi:hypothetical protein
MEEGESREKPRGTEERLRERIQKDEFKEWNNKAIEKKLK